MTDRGATDPADALLTLVDVSVDFQVRDERGRRVVLHAVDGVSLAIGRGETVGLVGESGSGKSTLARAIMRRVPLVAGSIVFNGTDITQLGGKPLRRQRRELQMVFQDPFSSLNPRMTIGETLAEPMIVHRLVATRAEARERVRELLTMVAMPESAASKHPHAFSGGQRQRICIARALAVRPKLVVADEPVSALDVSVQAQILELIVHLQRKLGVSFLFIGHDLAVVRSVAHRIAVMHLGRVVELGPSQRVCSAAHHPYTQALLSAALVPDPDIEATRTRIVLPGEAPSPLDPPRGCSFHTRCAQAQEMCSTRSPEMVEVETGHWAECLLVRRMGSTAG